MPVPSDWSQDFTTFVTEWKRKSDNREYIGYDYLGDNPFEHFVVTEKAESWDAFLRWIDEFEGSWCFRGQREACWTFETSLDRGVKREFFSPHLSSVHHLPRKTAMQELLYQFQQYAHTYLPHVPPMTDLSSWYSLMQHYCAPTPLLDWTESPFVAMYFAVESKAAEKRPDESESHSALWAIDSGWLDQNGHERLQESIQARQEGIQFSDDAPPTEVAEYTNGLLRGIEAPIVIRINPAMSNPRLFAQRGLFLCKLVEEASVAQLLMTMMMYPTLTTRPVIRKLEIPNTLRIKFLKQLRAMNIHRASLFPGLDGLGTSLKLDLELKDRD
jgi:hypothetical protein